MSMQKQQRMNMHFEKITLYSAYVSCLTRVIHDFIDNGNNGLKPTDIPNLMNLLLRYTGGLGVWQLNDFSYNFCRVSGNDCIFRDTFSYNASCSYNRTITYFYTG